MKIVHRNERPHLILVGPDKFPDDPDELEKGLFEPCRFEVHRYRASDDPTPPGDDTLVGKFTFNPMPGNCGVVVSTETWILEQNRRCGRAEQLHALKEVMARKLGYSVMLSTTIATNVPQIVSASKAKWRFVADFINKRTNNTCLIGVKHLK